MRKNIAYLLGSVILLALLVVAIFFFTDSSKVDGRDFAIENTEQIGKIFLADRRNNTVTLERKSDNHWMVNDKYKARESAIKELLRTMRLIKAKAPIPKAAEENVIKGMSVQNTKVEIYDRDGDLIKTYFVGAPVEGRPGNYMLMEGADQIYVVQIPGLNAMLQTRYFTNAIGWRDRTVFEYQPGEIERIKVNYPMQPTSSFQLEVLSRDSFDLTPMVDTVAKPEPDTRVMAQYVNNYQEIHAEAFLNSFSKKDSILSQPPYCIITVTDTTGMETRAELYYKPVTKRTKTQMDPQGNPVPYDLDRSYALINNGQDFVLIQHFVFGKLLIRYDQFFAGENESKK